MAKRVMGNKGAAILCIVLGIISLVVGLGTLAKQKKYTPVEAVITRIEIENHGTVQDDDREYHVYVKYQVGSKMYEGEMGYYRDGFAEGKTIDIMYNPENPEQIVQAERGSTFYFIIIGPLVILLGVYLFIRKR